jgi:hypothetical protein
MSLNPAPLNSRSGGGSVPLIIGKAEKETSDTTEKFYEFLKFHEFGFRHLPHQYDITFFLVHGVV